MKTKTLPVNYRQWAASEPITITDRAAAVQPLPPALEDPPASQHTPGPWHVLADPVWANKHPLHQARYITTSTDTENIVDGDDVMWSFNDPDAEIICTMPDAANQQANARLIASAPDLLEALRAVLELNHHHAHAPFAPDVAKICQTAIAKATGQA